MSPSNPVQDNQPGLRRQLKKLPWSKVPVLDETGERGHGRYDIRRLQAVTCTGALGLDFPHATQALRISRRRLNLMTGRWSTVTTIAKALRHNARDPHRPLQFLGTG